MISGKRVLITGGAGFIGSYLVEALLLENEVIVYDNLRRNALQYTKCIGHPNLALIKADVLDRERLTQAMEGVDVCIHSAAIAGIYSVGESVLQTLNVNLLGTVNALEAAVATGVRKVVEFSTSEVYGPFVYRGSEADRLSIGPTGEKRWTYALSKLASEHFAYAYSTQYSLPIVTVRPFNVYGPRQVGEGAIQQMTLSALRGEDIVVYNDGTQVRSWCFVRDFVDGLLLVLEADLGLHSTFNLGNPQATVTVLGLAQAILRLTGSSSRIVFRPHPGPEVEMRIPDIQKASKEVGFKASVGLEDGLRSTIDWYRKHIPAGSECTS
jgi:nucleoside-diphosphate-sugar epimerase